MFMFTERMVNCYDRHPSVTHSTLKKCHGIMVVAPGLEPRRYRSRARRDPHQASRIAIDDSSGKAY